MKRVGLASARSFALGRFLLLGSLLAATVVSTAMGREVLRVKTFARDRYLTIEFLDDNLVHFELSKQLPGPDESVPLAHSPMVGSADFPGPTFLRRAGKAGNVYETATLAVSVESPDLCVTVRDRARRAVLTHLCPSSLGGPGQSLVFSKEATQNLYGLGQQYDSPGVQDGDWMGKVRVPGDAYGNQMVPFNGGYNGNTQVPVLYALGAHHRDYAIFLDQVYKQEWDFTSDPFKVETEGDPLRWYFIAGQRLPELRRTYMDLVGHPLIPPKKLFGLWVSQYGYRNWSEVEAKLKSLRDHHFPVDGFMLDLFWFGGVVTDSNDSYMGRITWDTSKFPDPLGKIASLRDEQGVGIIPIEESYVSKGLPEHADLDARGFLVKDQTGKSAYLTANPWWGKGGMIDWTNPAAADYLYQMKQNPLVASGITGLWLDLGEPEMYPTQGYYFDGKPEAEAHNLFNLDWVSGIWRGYQKYSPDKRPFMLCRSGAAGMQRYGGFMWSGDIASDLTSLAVEQRAQMHMSLSGIDYYGADIGGFHRGALRGDLNEMYTQWFASGMLFDVPGRPHTDDLSLTNETSPDLIGDRESNLANLRRRYALVPYVYSLAHRAYMYAEPVFPPLVYYYQDDPNVRQDAHDKMIGPSLLAAAVARGGQTRADVYLPRGEWVDFRTDLWFHSRGEVLSGVPLYPDGLYQPPVFAKSGAIIPMMYVDDKTMNVFGKRTDGSRRDELRVRIYADRDPSDFVLYEDDGETTGYQRGAVRETRLSQRLEDGVEVVNISAAHGDYIGAPSARGQVVELVLKTSGVTSIDLDGQTLERMEQPPDPSHAGWAALSANRFLVSTGIRPVDKETSLRIVVAGTRG